MKKTFIPIAFIAVFATSMVSCQKETLQEPTPIVANIGNARTIKYSIDGIEYFIKLHGEKEWMQFVNTMMELSTQGHDITFAEANSVQREYSAKEIYTFTTKDQAMASAWAAAMVDEGYTVRVMYNEHTGIFTCIAIR